jgi:hypothetical protein
MDAFFEQLFILKNVVFAVRTAVFDGLYLTVLALVHDDAGSSLSILSLPLIDDYYFIKGQ